MLVKTREKDSETVTQPVGIKRDQWGRYILPDPKTGHEKSWTRATTMAKACSDLAGLTKWQLRMAIKGVAMRPDIYARIASTPIEDKKSLGKLAEDAKEAAASSKGANIGTALHAFTEQLDRDEITLDDIPADWRPDIEAYQKVTKAEKILSFPSLIERIVVVPELGVAGTADRFNRTPDLGLVVGDVKTGQDLSYGWGEIAVQLAIYAHASAMYNPVTGKLEQMPVVSKTDGLVIHLPSGQGKCSLYRVDLEAGWEAAKLCLAVRTWRGRKNLAQPYRRDDQRQVTPGTHSYEKQLAAATTTRELEAIWRDADARGAWTKNLTKLASTRKHELATFLKK